MHALPDREIDGFVGHDDVTSLREGRDDAGDGGESLSVDNACRGPQMRRDVRFRLLVNILRAVEARRTAWSNTVRPQRLYGLLFQTLVPGQVVEVVGRDVGDNPAVRELRLWTSRPRNVSKPTAHGLNRCIETLTRQ